MEEGRPVGHGFLDGEHRRQDLVFHFNEGQRFLGNLLADSRHRCHFVAHIAHLLGGQELLVAGVAEHAPLDAGRVPAGDDGLDPGQPFSLAGVNAHDAGVGIRAAQDPGAQHPGQHQIGGEFGLPGRFGRRINARHSGADKRVFAHGMRLSHILRT